MQQGGVAPDHKALGYISTPPRSAKEGGMKVHGTYLRISPSLDELSESYGVVAYLPGVLWGGGWNATPPAHHVRLGSAVPGARATGQRSA